MKPSTREAHLSRVDAVLARLQSALVQGAPMPGLEELAACAHLSPFHFHRVWRALTGETLGRSVARLRLSRALQLLEARSGSVTGAALASGYDSAQSLARACREAFDCTPGALRGDALRIAAARERLQPPGTPGGGCALRVEVVSLAPFEVVALRHRGRFEDLDAAFGALFGWAAEAGLAEAITGLHGVPCDDHRDVPGGVLSFDCAIGLDTQAVPPAPLRRATVGGGRCARVRHVGAYDDLEDCVDRILREWWPASGLALRAAPIHYVFLDDPEVVPAPLLRADIHLPLEVDDGGATDGLRPCHQAIGLR